MSVRSGLGFDSHAFAADGVLMLGGVAFPGTPALKGHSDGDALLHAVIDALLGACALGDIGTLFPDTDPSFKGLSSLKMLKAAVEKLHRAGFKPLNVDVVVLADHPKLAPARDQMRAAISEALAIPLDAVSVKGKTQEGLSLFGKTGGIAVWATATAGPK
jgi:2-C-methyl-D-erythritol 2,4-cyclodiphosphate synthase